jgi:hypothetical protein
MALVSMPSHGQTTRPGDSAVPISTEATVQSISPVVVARGQHHRVVESVRQVATKLGQSVLVTNRYTVVRNGMNFKDSAGNWVESRPVVCSFPNGIVCTGATYRVILNANLNTFGAVDLETSDQKRLVLHPLGIGFYDPESGRSVLLAQVTDCAARLVSSNQVAYDNAFVGSGIEAALTYTYGVGRFHQDVVFVRRPAVSPADFGMGSRARLEIFTEIIDAPPLTRKIRALKQETDALKRAQMVEPDLLDETLIVSDEMRMTLGRAFLTGKSSTPAFRGTVVAKRLLVTEDNRRVLVEAVEWSDVHAELEKLP